MEQLTKRQEREREYYNEYAKQYAVDEIRVDFAPIIGPREGVEYRPWNSYWAIYEKAYNYMKPGDRLLDFGSGPGENALRFRKLGYEVHGFDISEVNVAIAQKLFRNYGEVGNFKVANAEKLPYEDETFDLIVGVDILHHVDIPFALTEIKRVLKTGGKALFREPVESPVLDWIRNTSPVLAIAPKETSFEKHITEDERKLNVEDDKILKETFPGLRKNYYDLFSRFDKFYRRGAHSSASFTERFDHFLVKNFPFVRKLCGTVIYEVQK